MTTPITTVLLAAGEGRRMHSNTPKPLHTLCGLPMLDWVLRAAKFPGADADAPPIAVIGYGAEQIKACYGEKLRLCEQGQRRGTGGALLSAQKLLAQHTGRALILAGDLPLLTSQTLAELTQMDCAAAFLVAELPDPTGYGRVLRAQQGYVTGIAEEFDLDDEQKQLHEARVSAYCFDIPILLRTLEAMDSTVGRGELTMGDVIGAFIAQGMCVETLRIPPEEALGVNDRVQLAACAAVLRRRINRAHMLAGVSMIDPEAAYIDATVKLGRDCTIYPGVVLEGNTVIGEGTTLYPACRIVDSHIGRFCAAQGVVARDAVVGDHVTLGPYVNLRPGAHLKNFCKVGNYIEVKNSVVDEGSKLPHLSYIGDGDVGKRVNLGCGTVFVNYDGYKKHRTTIGDDAFIGCHTSLVAPVKVGAGSFTAAGSVITEDVPPETLAIARAKQVNKIGYVSRLKTKRGEIKEKE